MAITPGSLVAYIPIVGDVEIGEVSSIHESGDLFVKYHMGDTAARTPKEDVLEIDDSVRRQLKEVQTTVIKNRRNLSWQ